MSPGAATSLRVAVERRPRLYLALTGVAMVALNGLAIGLHGRWDADYAFVGIVFVQGGIYLMAARVLFGAPRGAASVAVVVAVAAALRLSVLGEAPMHSTDTYRYVWDGRVQAAGINPYRYVPAAAALAGLRDAEIYPRINRANYAVTIYPPAAQAAFWLFTRIAETVWAVKLGWLLLEAAAMAVIARLLVRAGRAPAELLLYAWHPLPVWEIACEGHVDAGMVALLIFALWAWAGGRRLLTGVLLASSVLFKPLTLAALPAFWRRWNWRTPLAFLAACALVYLPYIGIGTGALGFLPSYASEEGISTGQGFLILRLAAMLLGPLPAAAPWVYLGAGAVLLAGLAIACISDPRRDAITAARQAQILIFAFLIVLSPNYPWYFVALVPLGCLAPWLPARVLTLLSGILYAAPPIDADRRAVLVQTILYGTVIAVLIFDWYARRRVHEGARAKARIVP